MRLILLVETLRICATDPQTCEVAINVHDTDINDTEDTMILILTVRDTMTLILIDEDMG